MWGSSDPKPAKKIVAANPVGSAVKVYYSPNSPQMAVLVPGPHWSVYLVSGFGTVFLFAGLVTFLMVRKESKSLDWTAPYTPSEPVFGEGA